MRSVLLFGNVYPFCEGDRACSVRATLDYFAADPSPISLLTMATTDEHVQSVSCWDDGWCATSATCVVSLVFRPGSTGQISPRYTRVSRSCDYMVDPPISALGAL